jgi:hypothetical protein
LQSTGEPLFSVAVLVEKAQTGADLLTPKLRLTYAGYIKQFFCIGWKGASASADLADCRRISPEQNAHEAGICLWEAEKELGADGKLIAYIFIQKNAAVPSVV